MIYNHSQTITETKIIIYISVIPSAVKSKLQRPYRIINTLLTPDSLTVTSLILSTFASDNPLIAHSFFFVDIWTPCEGKNYTIFHSLTNLCNSQMIKLYVQLY